jgi:UDP-N-acetylglucosamine 2-epimerase (non-hydrolysing)
MKVLSVVGARPQFVKLAPVAQALAGRCEHVIVHTGQHYDERLSAVFFADLAIPTPDVDLEIGSALHGAQTGAMLIALEPVLQQHNPDWVLVYGDTNSTLAGALAAVKLHLPVAHLEAGLRSFNRRMPEEHNRVLTDHAADLCLAPTHIAMGHLAAEGLAARSVLVGDVMTDACLTTAAAGADRTWPGPPELADAAYTVATLHRPDNTDDPERLERIVAALAGWSRPVLLLAHPRLLACADAHRITLQRGAIRVMESQPYPRLVDLVQRATSVVTDSGGLQKEAFLLRTPCTTLRTETEWPETVDLRWNALSAEPEDLAAHDARPAPAPTEATPYGDGHAAARVADVLLR